MCSVVLEGCEGERGRTKEEGVSEARGVLNKAVLESGAVLA